MNQSRLSPDEHGRQTNGGQIRRKQRKPLSAGEKSQWNERDGSHGSTFLLTPRPGSRSAQKMRCAKRLSAAGLVIPPLLH